MNYFVAVDEAEPGERHDAVAVERGLEREIEAGERLDRHETRHLQRRFDPAALAHGEFLGEQHLDRLDGGELTTFELADELIEGLQSARHAHPTKWRRMRSIGASGRASLTRRPW